MRILISIKPSRTKSERAQSFARGSEQQNADKGIIEPIFWVKILNRWSEWQRVWTGFIQNSIPYNGFSLAYFISVCFSFRKWRKEVKISFFSSVFYSAHLIEIRCRMHHVNYKQRINECIDIRKCLSIGQMAYWRIKLNQKPENRIRIDYSNDNN